MALKTNVPRPNGEHRQDGKRPAREDVHSIIEKRFKIATGRVSNSAWKVGSPPLVKPPFEMLPSNGQSTTNEDAFSLLHQWSILGYFEACADLGFL